MRYSFLIYENSQVPVVSASVMQNGFSCGGRFIPLFVPVYFQSLIWWTNFTLFCLFAYHVSSRHFEGSGTQCLKTCTVSIPMPQYFTVSFFFLKFFFSERSIVFNFLILFLKELSLLSFEIVKKALTLNFHFCATLH